jgi:hypothetical protein
MSEIEMHKVLVYMSEKQKKASGCFFREIGGYSAQKKT